MVLLPGFHTSPWFGEQVRETWPTPDVHVVLNAAGEFDPAKPTRLLVYTTPNGNTVEQTLGSARTEKTDWHFDLQHIAAQVRLLRTLKTKENIVLACLEAKGLSWPAWRQRHPDSPQRSRTLVEGFRQELRTPNARVALAGHSGGGSFLFAFLNGGTSIPSYVDTIAFLDANYSYSDTEQHGDTLLAWLKADRARQLTVIAYDDREITLNNKKVVGPAGGTFRATERMRTRFAKELPLTQSKSGPVVSHTGLDGQLVFRVHQNPKNQILHTALVGEWNGLLSALSVQPLAEPRRYSQLIQPALGIPPRSTSAPAGSELFRALEKASLVEREALLSKELLQGNLPEFLRGFVPVTLRRASHTLVFQVMPDYLAVGSDADFVRVPLTPMTAQLLADAFGCSLPTKALVDAIYAQAALQLEPFPLTEAREAASTFAQHNRHIERQRQDKPLGGLVAGIKKDIVLTNRLREKPNRVAIYGWHKRDGLPIQPLSTVHRDTYVDYSHGIRLLQRSVLVDGKVHDLCELLQSRELCDLVSDEGPLQSTSFHAIQIDLHSQIPV